MSKWDSHTTWQLERLVDEEYEYIDITVEYSYHGDYVDINDVYDNDKNEIELTADEEKEIIDHIFENAVADHEADYADYRYEQWRDDRMMENWN